MYSFFLLIESLISISDVDINYWRQLSIKLRKREEIDVILIRLRYASCKSADRALYRFFIPQREVSVPLKLYRLYDRFIVLFVFPKKIIQHRINYIDIPNVYAKDSVKYS